MHTTLVSSCSGVRTLTTVIGLSGRAGGERLRGRVIAGFERPSSMRLEAVALGQPVFILAARGGSATLLLPGEQRILRNAPPDAILEGLAGVALGPSDLLAVFTGCVLPEPRPVAGRLHAGDWASIDIESGAQQTAAPRTATLFLRRAGSAWQLRAARRDRWQIEYTPGTGSFPESVRLASTSPEVNLGASLSDVEANIDIDPAAFTVEERKDLTPLTLDELRQAGPLREQ